MSNIILKEGMLLKSSDNEYVYNIIEYSDFNTIATVSILNMNLETISTRKWKVIDLLNQIEAGTIIQFKDLNDE